MRPWPAVRKNGSLLFDTEGPQLRLLVHKAVNTMVIIAFSVRQRSYRESAILIP